MGHQRQRQQGEHQSRLRHWCRDRDRKGSARAGRLQLAHYGGTFADGYWDTGTSSQTSSALGVGKTASELQTPIDYGGIYVNWNVDVDGDSSTDDPWDFGTSSQYPALKADVDGDGVATVEEFGGGLGHQLPRPGVVVSAPR